MIRLPRFSILAGCSALSCAGVVFCQDDSPQDAFVMHPGLALSVWASEPHIESPVALAWNAKGEAYVVEMRDYPYGMGGKKEPGGRIRLLRDKDEDGKVDEAKIFAENLLFPTSVLPWRNGILVTTATEIVYLEDADGDDKAEIRRVILTGFKAGLTDELFSSLRWGLDQRVHGVNGGNSGVISSPVAKESAGEQAKPLALRRNDLHFDPDTGSVGLTTHSTLGFGLGMDAFGHTFGVQNLVYCQQHIIPVRYTNQQPHFSLLAPFTADCTEQGPATRLFPVAPAATRPNHPEQAGHFSSACGTFVYEGKDFGPALQGSIFTCDPAGNVVHVEKLQENGPVFKSVRFQEPAETEFLAERNIVFRPVGVTLGPDGALYVIDMRRDVIEHPDYIPAKMKATLDIRAGVTRGRIYRIVPKDKPLAAKIPRLDDLVAALASDNAWISNTASRLLYEQKPNDCAPLEKLLRHESGPARCRALWSLHGLGKLTAAHLLEALQDKEPGVRENALILAESRVEAWPELATAMLARLADDHARVRFQAALSVSFLKHPDKIKRLADMWQRDHQNAWSEKAMLIAAGTEAEGLLRQVMDPSEFLVASTMATSKDLSWTTPLSLTPERLRGMAAGLKLRQTPIQAADAAAMLDKWAGAVTLETASEFLSLAESLQQPWPAALKEKLAAARPIALGSTTGNRIAAIRFLAKAPEEEKTLCGLFSAAESSETQMIVADALATVKSRTLGEAIIQQWPQIKPAVRPAIVKLLIDQRSWHDALLKALEEKRILPGELNLDLEQRRELLRWSGPLTAKRASAFFGDEEYANRKETITKILAELPEEGNIREGKEIYRQRCLMCHVHGNLGSPVGPALTGVSHRSAEDLITHIADPSLVINAAYAATEVVNQKDETIVGVLRDETDTTLTLVKPLGLNEVIQKKDIKTMRTLEKSLMPEGLDTGLSPFDWKSLIMFLQSKPAAPE